MKLQKIFKLGQGVALWPSLIGLERGIVELHQADSPQFHPQFDCDGNVDVSNTTT